MARVLVTGATGFIGRHLVQHLQGRGDQVRCLLHVKEERLPGLECVYGDITVPQTLDAAVRDQDIVYHLAGATLVVTPQRYYPINSLGTRHVGEACARMADPPTLVCLSSLAAAGPTIPDRPRREEDPPAPVSEYGRSKLAGEHFLRPVAARVPITVLRPPGVFGPGDPNLLALFKVARSGFNFIPGRNDPVMSMIYVDDLVHALPHAAERGRRLQGSDLNDPQGIYFVAMEETGSMKQLAELAAKAQGRQGVRTFFLPAWMGKLTGRVNDFVARFTRQPLLVTSDKMREALGGSWICSSAKARREWGFACGTGLADGIEKTARWYREQGLL